MSSQLMGWTTSTMAFSDPHPWYTHPCVTTKHLETGLSPTEYSQRDGMSKFETKCQKDSLSSHSISCVSSLSGTLSLSLSLPLSPSLLDHLL